MFRAPALLCLLLVSPAFAWPTFRGNPQRTGNTDGKPGPATPRIVWSFKSQDHFLASPVPSGDQLLVSGVGAFNVSTFYSLRTAAEADRRVAWSKTTPFLKLPTVSSPAIFEGQ